MNKSRLDHTDLCILNHLQEDSRLSTKELAGKLKMSSTAVFDRLKRLREQDYIKGYTTILNREKINTGLVVFLQIQLHDHSSNRLTDFKDAVNRYNEVRECYHMTGLYDFQLKIAVKDMPAYNQFLTERLACLPNLIHLQSYFVINESKFETSLRLELA
ncbi:MAG: Lrp/AsnC family transcriptional regulator [Bacteroidota bacterium]